MLKLGRVTKVTMLFLVLVFVFNFDLFKFSAAILKKGLLVKTAAFCNLHSVFFNYTHHVKAIVFNIFTDLPTCNTCKSGGFEKKPRKTWRLQKYASNENNNDRFFVSEYSLPY